MKTKLVAVIVLIFCAFMAEASKVEGNGNIKCIPSPLKRW
jgi:hypothetical protein